MDPLRDGRESHELEECQSHRREERERERERFGKCATLYSELRTVGANKPNQLFTTIGLVQKFPEFLRICKTLLFRVVK